ncbi:hypothetical protein DV735_g5406, partial [Chaetothyriales sp. CBS 134920]
MAGDKASLCYLGKKRLDAAIELYAKTYPGGKDDVFTISWLPFYVYPMSPAEGVPTRDWVARHYGRDRTTTISEDLRRDGKQVGIEFSFVGKAGCTTDAHRLIELAGRKGPAAGGDITSHEMLEEASVRAGLARDEVRHWLQTDKGADAVHRKVQRARDEAIEAAPAPTFTIQNKYRIEGDAEPQAFLDIFARSVSMWGTSSDMLHLTLSNEPALQPADIAAAMYPIRQKVQKAIAAIKALPDVDRTLDEQEAEIRLLEAQIGALSQRLDDLADRAGGRGRGGTTGGGVQERVNDER